MAENIIGLKSVRELLGLNFFIPDYQRGFVGQRNKSRIY